MSYDYDYEEYISGLHGLLQTLVRAARIDKKMQAKSFTKVFGPELGEFIANINANSRDPIARLLYAEVKAATTLAYLRGKYRGGLVVTPRARALMILLAMDKKFDWLNLPRAISDMEKAMRIMQRRVER